MTRALLHSAVVLVAAWMLWLILPRLVFPLFGETVLHEVRLAGIERFRTGAFRTQSECHALMPVSLFARVETCDPVPDGASGGTTLVVEIDAEDLAQARAVTESIRLNEPRPVCSGGSLITRAVCTETRPSDWLNPLTKYNFARLNAYAVGTRDDPPRLGAWRLESGAMGGFLVLGVLFVAGATIRLISVRLAGGPGAAGAIAITDSTPPDPETEIVEDQDHAPDDDGSASNDGDGDATGEAEARYRRPARSWVDRVKDRSNRQTGEREVSAVETPATTDALRKLIARMWVEGLEDGSDRLRGLADGLSRGTLAERVARAAEIDHLMRGELESEQASEGARAVPPPMIAAAWREVVAVVSEPRPGDAVKPPPLGDIAPSLGRADLPKTAEMLEMLRQSRHDGVYRHLADAAEKLANGHRPQANGDLIIEHCGQRMLGEAAVLFPHRAGPYDWWDLLTAVTSEIESRLGSQR